MATATAGSRSLFDEIYEDRVTFVIDTSSSMFYKLRAIKRQLMDCVDALSGRPETALNLVRFGGDVSQWARTTCRCTPDTAEAAKRWLAVLRAESGTNSQAALLAALDDDSCEAVYLVTDGPPESSADDFLDCTARAAAGRPVHCAYLEGHARDEAAVALFYELARRTRGSLTLARFGEGGLVERVTRLYRLDRHAYRLHCRNRRGTSGGGSSSGRGDHGASTVESNAGMDASTSIVLRRPAPLGVHPLYNCCNLYGFTNAFAPPVPLLAPPPLLRRRTPRVYTDGENTVLRVPYVGYRWPYIDYRYPYGWAPWAWTYSVGRRATSTDRTEPQETRTNDDYAAPDDDQNETDSDDNYDPAETRESDLIVPDTLATANEIEARAKRQISLYGATRQSSDLDDTSDSEYEKQYRASMTEISALEKLLEKKIASLDESTLRRGRALDEEIRKKRSQREVLCQQLDGLQKHRERMLSLRHLLPPDNSMCNKVSAASDNNWTADWEKMRSTPRLLSKPTNASRTPPANGDRRETRAPWARYWRATTN